jgi:hypothetical protein
MFPQLSLNGYRGSGGASHCPHPPARCGQQSLLPPVLSTGGIAVGTPLGLGTGELFRPNASGHIVKLGDVPRAVVR